MVRGEVGPEGLTGDGNEGEGDFPLLCEGRCVGFDSGAVSMWMDERR